MTETLTELIKNVSTKLPDDVTAALKNAYAAEEEGSNAKALLGDILENIKLARERSIPICQDTGSVIFFVAHPVEVPQSYLRAELTTATKKATQLGYLRPNSVDPLTGKNSGSGIGPGSPDIHFVETDGSEIEIRLLLKGGGSENVSTQYSLPDSGLDAARDLEGVKKCVIDAVVKAQGKGCAPGLLGVGIGGDRASSYYIAKKQLLRNINDLNPVEALRPVEEELLTKANKLGIGPMGIGGASTLLSVKIGTLNRVPASFFVSIAYNCWALRRGRITINVSNDGTIL